MGRVRVCCRPPPARPCKSLSPSGCSGLTQAVTRGRSLRPLAERWQVSTGVPFLGRPYRLPARHPREFLRRPAPRVRRKWTQRQREWRSCDHSPSGSAPPSARGAEVSCPVPSCTRYMCAHAQRREMKMPPGSVTLGWGVRGDPSGLLREPRCARGLSPGVDGCVRGGTCAHAHSRACVPAELAWCTRPRGPGVGRDSLPPHAPLRAEPPHRAACVWRLLYGRLRGVPQRARAAAPRGWVLGVGPAHVPPRSRGCAGTKSFFTGRGRRSESRPWAAARRAHPAGAAPAAVPAGLGGGAPATGRDVRGVS